MKKVLAFLLAAGMLSASLVGCSPETTESGSNEGESSTTQEEASQGSEDGTYKAVPSGGVAVSDPGVLPIVENKTDMTVYISQATMRPTNTPCGRKSVPMYT